MAKPFVIDKRWVWVAYKSVKRNKGCAGVDRIDFKQFDRPMMKTQASCRTTTKILWHVYSLLPITMHAMIMSSIGSYLQERGSKISCSSPEKY